MATTNRKNVLIVALVVLLLGTAVVYLSFTDKGSRVAPVPPRSTPVAAGGTVSGGVEPTVPFEVAQTKANDAGRFFQLIVVDPKYRKRENFPDLVATLDGLGRSSQDVTILVYDDMKAAKAVNEVFDASPADKNAKLTRFHDDHRIGTYSRNALTGHHEYLGHPKGLNGPSVKVTLPTPQYAGASAAESAREQGSGVSEAQRAEAARVVRKGMELGYIKELRCEDRVAYVEDFMWAQFDYRVKEGTARATARACGQEAVWTVKGFRSGKVVAEIGMLGGVELK